jgi:two-component system NtrC family sensor kinase
MSFKQAPKKDKDEFKQLERRIRFGLLFAFLILLGALALYFQLQFQYTIKETGRLNLAAIAESQRNTVDLFLQERVFNIQGLFHAKDFSMEPTGSQMQTYLENLQQVSDAVIDVGFLDAHGRQTGYAGSFPHLLNQNYSDQPWYLTLSTGKQNFFISDIYTGFRNKPHFTIGVKQIVQGQTVVLRATLDPDKFYQFLRTIHRGRGSESFIINQSGLYQVVDPNRGQLFDTSDYVPPKDQSSGASEIVIQGRSILMAHAWLKEADWALIVSEPLTIAYAEVYRARRIMFVSSILIILVVIAALWKTSQMLIGKAREQAAKKEDMYMQLVHATKMASLGELATGVAHEINNPLAIILATSEVLKDRLNPEFGMDHGAEVLMAELKTIDQAVIRARGITQQLLNYGRKTKPQRVLTDVNQLLVEVLSGFKAREFSLADIDLQRHFTEDLPGITTDPDQMRQVIFNLLNNAGDAISGPGEIIVSTSVDKHGKLHITIADTGCGMDQDQLKRIFDPFYSTKEVGKGTGLGLSLSLAIVESMGGTIAVRSTPGVGSSFDVIFPVRTLAETSEDIGLQASERLRA